MLTIAGGIVLAVFILGFLSILFEFVAEHWDAIVKGFLAIVAIIGVVVIIAALANSK